MSLTPAQWCKKHSHDALRARLEKLAKKWDAHAAAASDNNGLFGAVHEEADYRACASELREILG